jgi:aminopeptidase N
MITITSKRGIQHRIRAVYLLIFITLGAHFLVAQPAARPIDVLHYEAQLRLRPDIKEISGSAIVTVRNPGPASLASITLDLTAMTITDVQRDGAPVDYTYDGLELVTELPDALAPGDSTAILISYHGSPGDEGGSQPWGGCHWGTVSYFMGVGFHAPSVSLMRLWLPSHDVPGDKATFDVTFSVPEGLVVAGSGLLTEQHSADGWSSYRWVERHPTATYLFTYAAAEYAIIEDSWNGLPMQYYVYRADSARAVQYFSPVADMMEAFTAAFGPYPFDKVGYCITPIGSMEHQTMISYSQQLFRFESRAGSTAAHELAHMWWGNSVTCKDFSDTWLSEGFAVFAEMVYAEYQGGERGYLDFIRQTSQRYRSSTVPNEGMLPLHAYPRTLPSSNYPSTIYQKGAMALVMLRDVMGDEKFFEGLREYGRRHAYGNATTEDFRAVMEEYHATSLHWFFDQWVYKPGYPVYQLERVLDQTDTPFRLRISQVQDTLLYPLYAMPMDLRLVLTSGDTLRKRIETQAAGFQEFAFMDVPANTVTDVILDPRGLVLKRVIYRTVPVSDLPTPPPSAVTIDAVYPNPSSSGFTVNLSATENTPLLLVLYDVSGRETLREAYHISFGAHSIRLDTAQLPAGTYFLSLTSQTATTLLRVLLWK